MDIYRVFPFNTRIFILVKKSAAYIKYRAPNKSQKRKGTYDVYLSNNQNIPRLACTITVATLLLS